jgi:hypothetical protein
MARFVFFSSMAKGGVPSFAMEFGVGPGGVDPGEILGAGATGKVAHRDGEETREGGVVGADDIDVDVELVRAPLGHEKSTDDSSLFHYDAGIFFLKTLTVCSVPVLSKLLGRH